MLLYFKYNAYDIIAVFLCIHSVVIYMCANEYEYFWIYFADFHHTRMVWIMLRYLNNVLLSLLSKVVD